MEWNGMEWNGMEIKYRLGVLGDIHNNLGVIYDYIDSIGFCDTSIIQVGDFGYNFTNEQLVELNNYLEKTDNNLYVVRGNHDNLYNHYPKKNYTEFSDKLDNIRFLKDYETLEWNNKTILCIGGAISIDRKDREENISWWKNEAVEYIDFKELPKNVDIVISHTNPSSFKPYTFDALCYKYFKNDPTLMDELLAEREYMQLLFEHINPSIYIHGHYHFSANYYIGDCKVVALGVNELYQL